jgi:hypothetical protein
MVHLLLVSEKVYSEKRLEARSSLKSQSVSPEEKVEI